MNKSNILFYFDSKYINMAEVIFKHLKDEYNYTVFSDIDIPSFDGVVFHQLSYIRKLYDTKFDHLIFATDHPNEVLNELEKNLVIQDYDIMTVLEASGIILTFEGNINFLRNLSSVMFPHSLPDKEINKRLNIQTGQMHIVMSFNSKYLLPAATTIYTLFIHNSNCILHIFYIDLTLSERIMISNLKKLGVSNDIVWHYIDDDMTDKIHFDAGRYTTYPFFRFYAYTILDNKIDRCLWLDSDLMIRGSIRELYETEMGDEWYFASALEEGMYEKNQLGSNREYTNIGVLLMNLKKLRSDNMMNQFWDCLFAPDFNYPAPEQDALNLVFKGKIYFVSKIIWNTFPIRYFSGISEEDIQNLVDEIRIVHFVSAQKAWMMEYEEYWLSVAQQIPFTAAMYNEYIECLNKCVSFLEEESKS